MNETLCILLIDDSALFIHRIEQLLSERYDNVSIAIAGSYEDALTMFALKTPHVIFLDINLPDRSGIDLLVKIREMNRHVTIVMLTNNDPGEYLETCMRLGADYYVEKSMGFDSITGITDKALESLLKQK
ncbi:response regulator [Longitalea luteola]|uniref:response regulator n=1 Tax=Longitalea luteola TaxID=2812563 RepID=UPI001A95A0E6|nr:response regulator [Longitalea luteola]